MLNATTFAAFADEIEKIASVSFPQNVAPPSPGGSGSTLSSIPAAPISTGKITSKALSRTTLQKTNYTKPNTKVPQPFSASESQKALPPPIVQS